MTADDFRLDYAGMGEYLRSEDMEAAMLAHAEKVKAVAESIAPVYEQGPHPGRYKAAFSASAGVQEHKTTRAYGEVSNDAPEAFFVEFGTEHNPRHRTLGKAVGIA
ncbi:HK97 gp10 family phage protein [Nocardioides terrisoli]|uniref:HK97 gp10 family phage protein n=1 Tax=Nocardioides terrisoli TaxID=3388267 RepID=UPI00287B5B90|nr:HK97 gp10 family phage protein [Nocardioides marmorisolisilvae]